MRGRYLITADRLDWLDPVFDLGVCVSVELLSRGIEVDYLDLPATDPEQPPERFLGALPVRQIRRADAAARPFWELGPVRQADVGEYAVILQRKDPPVDDLYVRLHRPFEHAPPHVVQVNRPPAIYQLSEHLLPLDYSEWAAPTAVCTDLDALEGAVRALPGRVVVKPANTYCSWGVTFFRPDAPRAELAAYLAEWGPKVLVQPYLEAFDSTGDLRILTMNGKVLGSVLRVAQPGSRLANLHQGGKAVRFDPTPRQLEACARVAADLEPQGIHLIGFDFIGEHLTEVNITSPTLIVQVNQVMGIRADVALVDELERMWRSRR